MSIYINDRNKVNDIFINVNGKKKINSMWVNKNGNPTKVFSTGKKIYDFSNITWADGTDEEIAAMLDAHYAGLIDIHDYWHVGDKRVVHLSAMEAQYVGESHVEQDVTMVLMNAGGKTLTEPINGVSECAFIVGQKEILSDYIIGDLNIYHYGYMHNPSYDGESPRGWKKCERRTWCNETYRNSLPDTFKLLFKSHTNIADYNGKYVQQQDDTIDYFALPSEKELLGTTKYTNEYVYADNDQFAYYTIANNIKKKIGINGSSYGRFALRSSSYLKNYNYGDHLPYGSFCGYDDSLASYSYEATTCGFSPFGCI